MTQIHPGLFITFEGIDGAGKSTQIEVLAQRLAASGRDAVRTREPGGAPGAEEIRALLVSGETGRWSAETELLLFTAARRDHVEKTVIPALDRGAVVLCDRYVDSTRVYQAAGRGAPRDAVDALHDRMIGLDPDLTLIFDLDPAEAHDRMRSRGENGGGENRFERFGLDFQHALRAGFADIAAAEPARCVMINAACPAEDIARSIWATVAPRLSGKGA